MPSAGNPRLVLNLGFQYKKSPLINLNQAFNQNPVNFVDPMGLVLKLSSSEMVDFEENLYRTISDLYYKKYAIEQNNFEKYQLIMGAVRGYDLKTLVEVFNEETKLNLEVPEEMGFFDRIFGTSESFFNMSKKVGEKVRKFFGSEEAQERIKKAPNHWLVQEGVCLPGLLTIGDQLNLSFANGAGSFAEFTTEEIQWIMVAGVLKGGIKYLGDLKIIKNVKVKWSGKIQKYKEGDMTALEHIIYRHSYTSGAKLKSGLQTSRFYKGMSVKDLRNLVDEAATYGTRAGNSITYDFGRVIGTDPHGNPATKIQIFLGKEGIRTAYPF
jgi:hypothetical protein